MVGCDPRGPNGRGLYLQFPNDYLLLDLCRFLLNSFFVLKNQFAVFLKAAKRAQTGCRRGTKEQLTRSA